MKFIRNLVLGVASTVLLGTCLVWGADETDKQELKLKGVKCLFCKMDVIEEAAVEYKGARVFFGCAGCPEAFKKDPKKYATQANAQLFATGQARQKACPISGRPTDAEHKLAVGTAKVSFCCPNCKQAAAKLEGDAQLEKIFNEAAFKKAFEIPKAKKDKA